MTGMVIKNGRGLGELVRAQAIVLPRSFSFFGGLNWKTGEFTLDDPELRGVTVKGKVLVFRSLSGGQGTAWKIGEMSANGCAPAALIVRKATPVLVSGCVLARMPMIEDLEGDPTQIIKNGDQLLVEPQKGSVTVLGMEAEKA